jgi:hypothetical protein
MRRFSIPALLLLAFSLPCLAAKGVPARYRSGTLAGPSLGDQGRLSADADGPLVFEQANGRPITIAFGEIRAASVRMEGRKPPTYLLTLTLSPEGAAEFLLESDDAWDVINTIEQRVPSSTMTFEAIPLSAVDSRTASMKGLRKKLDAPEFVPALAHSLLPREPAPEMARIYFHRNANMLGAIAQHVVIDRGPGQDYDTVVLQRKTYPDHRVNFDKMANVRQIYFRPRDSPGPENNDPTNVFSNVGGFIDSWLADALEQGVYAGDGLEPNAVLIGVVRSGTTVVWDRPPGTIRLQTVTNGGDQAFGPPMEVKAGKSYLVNFSISSAKFRIHEITSKD